MNNIYSSIQQNLSKRGINVASCSIYDLISMWKQWYRGNVEGFHNYVVKNSEGAFVPKERFTMNMAKKIPEDYSKLLWTEKTEISIGSKEDNDKLWIILDSKRNNFSVNFPIFLEKAFALGTGMMVEYKENNETVIDYIEADCIMPYEYTNGYIFGVISISRTIKVTEDDIKQYNTVLTFHEYKDGIYTRYSEAYMSTNENDLGIEQSFEELYPNVINPYQVKTDTPYFQIIKPNIANNYDTNNPMGISIIANSMDKLKAIDIKYDSFSREFDLGKKRIVVDNSALKVTPVATENGVSYTKYLDTDDMVYVAIPGMEGEPIKEIDFELRTQEHIESINSELNWLSSGVGLGQNYYKFDGQGIKTATEVMSENSDTFRSREHHLIIVNDAICDLVKAICHISGINVKDVTITPDDSIIEDKTSIKVMDMQEITAGLQSKKRYLMKNYGMSESEAKRELEEIENEKKNKSIFNQSVEPINEDIVNEE